VTSDDRRTVTGWVFEDNLRPLAEVLSGFINYRFDDWDWDAISTGLHGGSGGRLPEWFDYPLVGTPSLTLEVAQEAGASVTDVRVHVPDVPMLVGKVEGALAVLSSFLVAD
jgi:hypothetical protein